MSKAVKLLILAVNVIIAGVLTTIAFRMYQRVGSTASEQQASLASVQSEYENSDVLLLNGEIVPAAEAISLARKYKSTLSLYKGDELISSSNVLNRNLFAENTNWLVSVQTNVNGVAYAIQFTDLSSATTDPQDALEAKARVAAIIGSNVNESWDDILSKVQDARNNDAYRERLAVLAGVDSNSAWSNVYTALDKALSTYEGSTVHTSEQFTIPINGSHTWSMDSPSYCVLEGYNSYGLIIFNGSNVRFYGDYSESNVIVDYANKTIRTVNLEWATKCTMLRN